MSEDDNNAQKKSLQTFRKTIIAEDHFKNCFLKAKYKEMRPTSRLLYSTVYLVILTGSGGNFCSGFTSYGITQQ